MTLPTSLRPDCKWRWTITDAEILKMFADAEREANANETAMLVSPLAIMGLVERLQCAETKLAAIGSYDELHDA